MPHLRSAIIPTPLGDMLAASITQNARESLCLLEFHDRRALPTERRDLERFYSTPLPDPTEPTGLLAELAHQLAAYFAGSLDTFDLPLDYPGTPFRRRVWQELLRIPRGQTISYIELARRVGKPAGSRAVGQANGKNRIAIIIPCHRVIAADGTLGGYGGKLWRKQRLLELEGAVPASLIAAAPALT